MPSLPFSRAAAMAFDASSVAAEPGRRHRLALASAQGLALSLVLAGLAAPASAALALAGGKPVTLVVDASSLAVAPSLYPEAAYAPAKAFTVIGVLAQFPNVLVAHPPFAPANVREVLAMACAKPGALAFASSGNGPAQPGVRYAAPHPVVSALHQRFSGRCNPRWAPRHPHPAARRTLAFAGMSRPAQ